MEARAEARGARWRWLVQPFTHRGLAGLALAGFFLLSVAATGVGFADLRAAGLDGAALGPVDVVLVALTTLFVVSAMVVALHHAFFGRPAWLVRPLSLVFYLFFAFWSVGFGYGFFWKELAGREFTERQFARVTGEISGALAGVSEALAAADAAAQGAAELARERASAERAEGGTCANRPGSSAGDGPLVRSRFALAERVEALAADARARWIAPLEADRRRLGARLSAIVSGQVPADAGADDAAEEALLARLAAAGEAPSAERGALYRQVHEDAQAFAAASNRARELNAGTLADRLDAPAAEVGADPRRPGRADPARADQPGYCWDVVLSDRLAAAAGQLRRIAPVEAPPFEFLEGPAATRAAFFALARGLGGLLGVTPEDQRPDFGEREFLALFASLAVDLGIFFLTVIRDVAPGGAPPPGKRGPRRARGPAPATPRLASILDEPALDAAAEAGGREA
jgi:hypothetical protein